MEGQLSSAVDGFVKREALKLVVVTAAVIKVWTLIVSIGDAHEQVTVNKPVVSVHVGDALIETPEGNVTRYLELF